MKNLFFNNHIKSFLKKHYPIIILVFIALITHWRWIFLNDYFSSGDITYFSWFVDTCRDLFTFPSIWSSLYASWAGFGGVNVLLSYYPSLYFIYAGLSIFFHSTIISSKLVFLIPFPIISAIGSFLLIQYLLKNKLAGFIGSIVYSYNVYTLILQVGQLQLNVVYASAPLIIYFFIKSIDNKKLNLSMFAGFVSFIVASYDFRIFYIIAWVILFYIIYQILLKIKDKAYSQIISILQYGLIPFMIMALLSSFWLIPFYFTNTLSQNELFSRGLFGNQFSSLSYALTFFVPMWTNGRFIPFIVHPIPFYFWLIPIFALFGFIFNFKNKNVLFFTFVATLGVLLAKQADYPFPYLYEWLYYHLPTFNAFREASKFYLLIALGYSVLIGALGKSLIKFKTENTLLSCMRYFVIVLIASLFLWNTRTLITGEIGGIFISRTLPDDYRKVKDLLNNDSKFSRSLWIPAFSIWSFFDNNHPRYNLYDSYYNNWGVDFAKNSEYVHHTYPDSKIIAGNYGVLNMLNQNFSNNFLDITNTRLIVVPAQDNTNDDDVFLGTSINDRKFIINFLDQLSYLKKINIGTKTVMIYENSDYKPLIYTTSIQDSVYSTIPYKVVNYKFINPTEYSIQIDNLRQPVYLNFNNFYAKAWALDLGDKHYLPDKDHLQTDMKFNAFYLNPAEIIKNYNSQFYTRNSDGSIDIKLKLYYKDQDLVNVGVFISLTTFILLSLYFIVNWFKRKKLYYHDN